MTVQVGLCHVCAIDVISILDYKSISEFLLIANGVSFQVDPKFLKNMRFAKKHNKKVHAPAS